MVGGMISIVRSAGALLSNYVDMRRANTIGADKYFHCKGNCEAAQQGAVGAEAAKFISDLRELYGRLKGDPAEDEQADQEANRHGREGGLNNPTTPCSTVCRDYRPRGLEERYDH